MEELINRILNGNDEAIEELVQIILPVLYNFAYDRLKNEADANDATQETIIKLYKNLHKLRHKEYFKTWIIEILKNECNKIFNKRKKHIKIFEKEKVFTEDEMVENPIENIDMKLDFDKMIENLSEEEKTLLNLYYNDGYETSEIANMLDQNVNTIRSKILRAKIKVKNKMKGGTSNG